MKSQFFVSIFLTWTPLIIHSFSSVLPRSDVRSPAQSHRINQVRGGKKPPGSIARIATFNKYGIHVPEELSAAAETARKSTSVQGVGVENDIMWLWPATIGGTELQMIFDTGSQNLWAASTSMLPSERGNHSLYDPSVSGRLIQGESFHNKYGTGGSSGIVYMDKVTVGSITAITPVGAAMDLAARTDHATYDGVMGFALIKESTCAPKPCNSFFDIVAPSLPSPIYAVALRHDGPGTWDFGFINRSMYSGQIHYTRRLDFPRPGRWAIQIQGYSINSSTEGLIDGFPAMVDTGSTDILVNRSILEAFYAKVPGAHFDPGLGGYVFLCDYKFSLPDLSFWIEGQMWTVPGLHANRGRLHKTSRYCLGGVNNNADAPMAVLGDVFLKSKYVVFDPQSDRVGIAQQRGVRV